MEFTISEKDIVKANVEIGLGTIKTRIILSVICVLLIGSGLLLKNNHSGTLLFAGFSGLIGYLLAVVVFIPYKSRSAYRSYKILQLPVKLEVLDTGISFHREIGEFTVLWGHIYAWKNLKSAIAVMTAKNIYHLIPKEQIGEVNSNNIIEQLNKHVGKAT
jgi:hypothetical protein